MNDDAEFERMPDRLTKMLEHFEDVNVAAVGPATGTAMGRESVEGPDIEPTKVLVGFCVLVRRSALEEVGDVLLDWDLRDDIDLCIRFSKYGYKMVIDRRVFVYHHAFKTGQRLYGKSNIPGGWNSQEMATDVYDRISAKHGTKRLMELIACGEYQPEVTKLGD